jgi:RNA polymerase sigma-70 factor, ECF subfamily
LGTARPRTTCCRPWAYRIASREAFRFLARRQTAQARDVDDATLETLPEPVHERPAPADLERLIEHASPASRAVLLLHYRDDLTIEEIAAVLGIPAGTVKSRLAYGLQRLREGTRRTRP